MFRTETVCSRPSPAKNQPGSRGIRLRLWYNAWGTMKNPSLSQFMTTSQFLTGSWNVTWDEQGVFEAPTNLMNARSDPTGPFGQLFGFFRPPKTSNYTFVMAVDDMGMLWLGKDTFNTSEMDLIISVSQYVPFREW